MTPAQSTLDITVNGEAIRLAVSRLPDALSEMGYDPEQPGIAVAVNLSVVPRSEWDETELDEGDQVDIVGARQGG